MKRHISTYRFSYISLVLLVAIILAYWSLFEDKQELVEVPAPHATITETLISQELPPEKAEPVIATYIEITGSCAAHFEGGCVNVRSGPGLSYESHTAVRNGIVLKVRDTVVADGMTWYHVAFDEWLRYPERLEKDWYISALYATPYQYPTEEVLSPHVKSTTTKRIVVDRGDQTLTAYEGNIVVFEEMISTGIDLTPTPRGYFTIFRKTPSRYMQGPLPGISEKVYDLPGVPWNLYFTEQGAVIHGAYWHTSFGKQWSNGCVNLDPHKAKKIYDWTEVGTQVLVRD